MYDMPMEKAIKQVVKTRNDIIDHNILEDQEMDIEFQNIEHD